MKLQAWLSAAALAAGLGAASAAFGQVTGTAKFDGTAPEMKTIDMSAKKECADQHPDPVTEQTVIVNDGKLKNVVVFVKPTDDGPKGEMPSDPVVLDQKGCMYEPHVIPMMVGQKMMVKNSDPFQHNVHSLATKNEAFNFGQANKDDGKPVNPPGTPETYRVKCDVHTWMSAWVLVLPHPYFGVSGDDGTFSMNTKGLPDGKYTLVFWHEKYGNQEKPDVEVKDGKADVGEITFKDSGADASESIPAGAQPVAKTMKADSCCSSCDSHDSAMAKKDAKAPAVAENVRK
jgi:plastocyanin